MTTDYVSTTAIRALKPPPPPHSRALVFSNTGPYRRRDRQRNETPTGILLCMPGPEEGVPVRAPAEDPPHRTREPDPSGGGGGAGATPATPRHVPGQTRLDGVT